MQLQGTYTALVTPLRDGAIDLDAYRRLLELQREAGVAGVVPCGSTGEAATLGDDERAALIDTALEVAGSDLFVIAGTGTYSTAKTIAYTKAAESAGAQAAMVVTPYYNKPSPAGLLDHYLRVAEATTIPLILYNVPGRTGITLQTDTVAELAKTGRFVAIKEAGGKLEAVSDLCASGGMTVLSGDDELTVPMMSIGAKGVVSVVSNVLPDLVRDMVNHALAGDFARASELHYRLLPVMRAAFIESNPSPVKAMLSLAGLVANELRPPLAPVGEASMGEIRRVIEPFRAARST